ncbi:MAG TPA: hypothetical protein VGD67_03095 [Pseudonocardiaceae bacterium]
MSPDAGRTAPPSPAGATPGERRLREELTALLQESDPHRPLDSLETVVVRTHLNQYGVVADPSAADRPTTIEGWVTWVAERSPGS